MRKTVFKLVCIFIVIFTLASAKEVTSNEINKNLSVVSLSNFNDSKHAKKIVQKFSNKYDIYTGFQNGKYYQYAVNIETSLKDEVLKDVQKIVSDAYFIKKEKFDYGIILLNKEDTKNDQQKNNPQLLEESITQEKPTKPDLSQLSESDKYKNLEESLEVDGLVKVDLVDVVLQTLSRSYKIQAAREKLIQAQRNIDIANAGFKPSVDVAYSISKNRREPGEDTNGNPTSYKQFNDERYSLKVDQNIYAGGETTANLNKVKMDYLIAKNTYQGLIEKEITKAINAYFDIVFRREALRINEKNIEQLQTIFKIVQGKFESGALSRGELSNVEASIANAMSQLSQTKSKYNNAIEYYQFISGEMFKETYPFEKEVDIKIDDFEILKQEALENNNKLKGISYTIASKNNSLKMAKATFRPEVNLQLSAEKILDKEDYKVDESEYMAKLSIKYNLYSGGRDKASYLKAYSTIRESRYEKEEQIREILWNLEKMYTSLMSLKESIESVKTEVVSSQNMVDSYWEAFRLGEQDLYILLQAQRQLNTAELDLIDAQLGRNTSFFKILEVSGKLVEYFHIDLDNDNFLDMTQGRYQQRVRAIKEKKENMINPIVVEDSKEEKIDNANDESIDENITVQEYKFTIQDLLSFSELFLIENSNNFTVVFEDFENIYDTLSFITDTKIEEKVFIYRTLKNEKVMTHLAYNVFKNKEDAQTALELEKFNSYDTKSIMSVGDVQNEWMKFNETKLMQKREIAPIIVEKKVSTPPFKTDEVFKKKFLDADPNLFTINVTTFQTIKDAASIVKLEDIGQNSFVFKYGDNNQFVKLMYGVYETYEEAKKVLESMNSMKSRYVPVIEKIDLKQKLYKRYNK